MPKESFGSQRFLELARVRWESRRMEFTYLLTELNEGRSLQELVGLIAGADMARQTIRETVGAGRQTEKLLRDLLKRTDKSEDRIVRQTLEVLLDELTLVERIFAVLKNRIRAGEVFGKDQDVPGRKLRVYRKRWKNWLDDTEP